MLHLKYLKLLIIYSACFILLFACRTIVRVETKPDSEARFRPYRIGNDSSLTKEQKIKQLKTLVDNDPSFYMASSWYIELVGIADSADLEKQYAIWMKKFPTITALPLALGRALADENNAKAKLYFKEVLKIDPKSNDAWRGLYLFAYFENDRVAETEYIRQGTIANPEDAGLAYTYARRFDKEICAELLNELIKKFPKSEQAVISLNHLAWTATDPTEKIKYYEKAKQFFLEQTEKFEFANTAVITYYKFLLTYDVEKTLPLLNELQAQKFRPYDWKLLQEVSNKVIFAKSLIKKKEGFAALTVLNGIKFPNFLYQTDDILSVLKAEALVASGKPLTAYENLITAFGKYPSTKKYKEIVKFGLAQGKGTTVVNSNIIALLRKNAVKATPFKLLNLKTNDSTSLKDFLGSAVLLTYWFPRCGPCRGEFPHFEKVLKKETSGIKYVGINIVAKENDMVLPIIAANNYTFIPLTETKYRNKGNLDNMGAAPQNFLIDKDGYLIFKNFMINENNERDLELMINLLN